MKRDADTESGSIRTTVLDANGTVVAKSNPITSNVTDEAVTMVGGSDLVRLRGQPIHLKFELTRAKIYAFSFDD